MERSDAFSNESNDDMKELSQEAPEKAREAADHPRERIAESTDRVQEQVELGRERAASRMERAATLLRDRSSDGAGKVSREATDKVAQAVEGAAVYLQRHKTTDVMRDASRYAKEHPWRAVIVAVLAGLLLARIFR